MKKHLLLFLNLEINLCMKQKIKNHYNITNGRILFGIRKYRNRCQK